MNYSALSVDVEDGINVVIKDYFNQTTPPTDRVVKNTNILIELFNEYKVNGTFFILGEVANEFPSLVKSISAAGHEVGVHGYHHDQIFKLTPAKLREDLNRAKKVLEDITGKQIYGFRAPAFSIIKKTAWALDILAEIGFLYDSSIVPVKSRRYGWDNFNKDIQRISLPNGSSIIEFPISTSRLFGKEMPACGGGYLRHFPIQYTQNTFRKILKKRPVMVYMHPYELDTEKYPDFFFERVKELNIHNRLKTALFPLNKGTVKKKLETLLKEFKFEPIIDIIRDYDSKSLIMETGKIS